MKIEACGSYVIVKCCKSKRQKEIENEEKRLKEIGFEIPNEAFKDSHGFSKPDSYDTSVEKKKEINAIQVGVVTDIGPTAFDRAFTDKKIDWYKIGDQIIFARNAGVKPPSFGDYDNLRYRILADHEILAKVSLSKEEEKELDNEGD
jgi:co-chaperonin GroES (HSP10)